MLPPSYIYIHNKNNNLIYNIYTYGAEKAKMKTFGYALNKTTIYRNDKSKIKAHNIMYGQKVMYASSY